METGKWKLAKEEGTWDSGLGTRRKTPHRHCGSPPRDTSREPRAAESGDTKPCEANGLNAIIVSYIGQK